MSQFSFTKMHGLGNSYIYVNMFEEQIPEEDLALVERFQILILVLEQTDDFNLPFRRSSGENAHV